MFYEDTDETQESQSETDNELSPDSEDDDRNVQNSSSASGSSSEDEELVNRDLKTISDKENCSPCAFCLRSEINELKYGPMYQFEDLIVHYLCMLVSPNLVNVGADHEGIKGFLMKDIKKELKRGSRLKCTFCKKTGASIACAKHREKNCNTFFHYPCGIANGVVTAFKGQYRSYCRRHKKEFRKPTLKHHQWDCGICFVQINKTRPYIWPLCCSKDRLAIYHTKCIQKTAFFRGRKYFRCPSCGNAKEFRDQVRMQGIYIPDKNSEPDEEFLFECVGDADGDCLCPKGAKFDDKKSRKWTFVYCKCGEQAKHIRCSERGTGKWNCEVCNDILGRETSQSTQLLKKNQSKTSTDENSSKAYSAIPDKFLTNDSTEAKNRFGGLYKSTTGYVAIKETQASNRMDSLNVETTLSSKPKPNATIPMKSEPSSTEGRGRHSYSTSTKPTSSTSVFDRVTHSVTPQSFLRAPKRRISDSSKENAETRHTRFESSDLIFDSSTYTPSLKNNRTDGRQQRRNLLPESDECTSNRSSKEITREKSSTEPLLNTRRERDPLPFTSSPLIAFLSYGYPSRGNILQLQRNERILLDVVAKYLDLLAARSIVSKERFYPSCFYNGLLGAVWMADGFPEEVLTGVPCGTIAELLEKLFAEDVELVFLSDVVWEEPDGAACLFLMTIDNKKKIIEFYDPSHRIEARNIRKFQIGLDCLANRILHHGLIQAGYLFQVPVPVARIEQDSSGIAVCLRARCLSERKQYVNYSQDLLKDFSNIMVADFTSYSVTPLPQSFMFDLHQTGL